MSTIRTLKAYAAGELTRTQAALALADAGGLMPVSIGEMLEDPVGALDEYEAAFERIRQSILALDGQGRTPEERRRIKELVSRVEALPSVWEGSF